MKRLILICLIFAAFYTGWQVSKKCQEPIIKEVVVTKNVDRVIYRDYTTTACCDLLQKYDQSPMIIKYNVTGVKSGYTDVTLKWQLYEREGEQEIRVPAWQSGNWKLYAGIGVGVVAAGGLVYLLK